MAYSESKAACVSYSYGRKGGVSWPDGHARAQDRTQQRNSLPSSERVLNFPFRLLLARPPLARPESAARSKYRSNGDVGWPGKPRVRSVSVTSHPELVVGGAEAQLV